MSAVVHEWVEQGRHRVRFAAAGGPFQRWSDAVAFVRRAEELGFDAYWYNDHPTRAVDPWAMLAALAVSTERIRLLPLVSCVYYRSAAQTARLAADVDILSGGRLILGLGIGDDEEEFSALGLAYPSIAERQQLLARTLESIAAAWGSEPLLERSIGSAASTARLALPPVQRPHVPVLVAGGGERVTLRQVARYADMSNFGPHEWTGGAFDGAAVRHKLEVLQGHCQELGRSFDSILRSHYSPLVILAPDEKTLTRKTADYRPNPREYFEPLFATPWRAVEYYQELADAGIQYFLTNTRSADVQTLELLAEFVLPNVHLPTG
jgi:alkanesulfonate monooxygenase SsuD/methylene tetrahydromethanopterin reductase-like flavin-dependent oxidoreductase (luciferase family)